jgi:caffeoyl-CoA O-methyltransferase
MNFDLVFIDADKENYARYYDLVINRVPLGGYILADNVLWSGKVLDEKVIRTQKPSKNLTAKFRKIRA